MLVQHWNTHTERALSCATTGAAAIRLSGTPSTAHHLFSLPFQGSSFMPLDFASPKYQRLGNAHVVVLDEMSMLTSQNLNHIMNRLQEVWGRNWRQEKLLLLVGDMAQLPPVCKHTGEDKVCPTCSITKNLWWKQFTPHSLAGSVRHANDPEFVEFLNKIRHDVVSQECLDESLGECYANEEVCLTEAVEDDVVICTHNEDVRRFNDILGRRFLPHADWHDTRVETNIDDSSSLYLQNWLKRDLNKFKLLGVVAVGARVVLLRNVGTQQGYVNGAEGKITGLSIVNGEVTKIKVLLNGKSRARTFSRTMSEKVMYQGVAYYRKTFPLSLSYAITAHKSQGATFKNKVFLFIRHCFLPGQLYVMLSRVTMRKNIVVASGQIKRDNLIPMPRI